MKSLGYERDNCLFSHVGMCAHVSMRMFSFVHLKAVHHFPTEKHKVEPGALEGFPPEKGCCSILRNSFHCQN